eukprot:TRINITY_DN1344_c0_g1_i1.p1 TRINITY_DN1344_c0_g1~~TRINITY_DN1344_c0_g1_i1.p1  ORF type:complete len:240 (+),score=65.51 TRINITY_DN1344_c0_g1_i1:64-783(+)
MQTIRIFFFFLMIRRPPRSTLSSSSAASDVYKRQVSTQSTGVNLCVMAASDKPVAFFVLGGPGAGKGTQCGKMVEHFGFKHLSAGDLLRAERASGSENATLINNYIKEGAIVPVAITVGLIKDAMEKSEVKQFLIDGFPRNVDNVAGWEEVMGDFVDVKAVLFYQVSEETLEKRLLGRDEGRADDNIETIKKRFKTYQDETMPVIEMFQGKGMVREMDGGRPIDDVWEDTKAVVNELLN